jgi:hypothetical protein
MTGQPSWDDEVYEPDAWPFEGAVAEHAEPVAGEHYAETERHQLVSE